MARIAIYLPDALKTKMDRIKGGNWSGVAQEAFADYIERASNRASIKRAVIKSLGRADATRFFKLEAERVERHKKWLQGDQANSQPKQKETAK